MSDPQRHVKLRQRRIAAGLCARCGKYPPKLGQRHCGLCLEYERAKQRKLYRRTGGKGLGLESTSRANGKKQAAKWRARGIQTVVLSRPKYPADSWWAYGPEQFEARLAREQERMKAALLPKSFVTVLDGLMHGERGAW